MNGPLSNSMLNDESPKVITTKTSHEIALCFGGKPKAKSQLGDALRIILQNTAAGLGLPPK